MINLLALVGPRDNSTSNSTVNQPEVLVQQVGSVALFSSFHEGRLASPLAILAPQHLELFYLLVLARHLEIRVYCPPGTVECTNDPAT